MAKNKFRTLVYSRSTGEKQLLINSSSYSSLRSRSLQWRTVYDINTAQIRLFFLRVLWRADISDNIFFEDVNLDAEHREKIRSMIAKVAPKFYNFMLGIAEGFQTFFQKTEAEIEQEFKRFAPC